MIEAFYTDEFVLPLPSGHRFPMEKYRILRDKVSQSDCFIKLSVPPAATAGQLALAHCPGYVQRIEEGTDLWLISLNERGEEIWQKSYNFKNRDVLMGMSVIESLDDKSTKGVLLGGYTQAEDRIKADDETFWLLYIDQIGNESWRKHITGESRKKEERLSDLKLNRDGSIVLAGTSAEELGKENWKIVKLGDKQVDQLIEKYDIIT